MAVGRRAPLHDLLVFVDLESRQFEVLDHLLAQYLPHIIVHVLFQDSSEQGVVALDHEADGKDEQISERSVIHRPAGVPVAFFMLTGLLRRVNQ